MEDCNSNTPTGEANNIMSVPAVNENRMREHLSGHPGWVQSEVISWVRSEEARGHAFTSGQSAVANYFNEHR